MQRILKQFQYIYTTKILISKKIKCNESKNSNLWNLWNRMGEIDDIDSTDFLGRLYERDRFLYSYWIYALSTSEYFHTLASEYFLRIKYHRYPILM